MLPDPPWMTSPPRTLKEASALLLRKRRYLRSPGRKGKFLRSLLAQTEEIYTRGLEAAKRQNPFAAFKPGFEQALILNAWMYGIAFVAIYSANRIGKTTAAILNMLLWIFPNNPKWQIFQPYEDHLRRRVRVFPRPDISVLARINDHLRSKPRPPSIPDPNPRLPHYHHDNFLFLQWLQTELPGIFSPVYPNSPWNRGGTIWFGAPDQDHHEQVMFPLWKEYIPAPALERYVTSEREISLKIQHPEDSSRFTAWELIGKSYESKDTKWSSGAVDAIILTEGITPAIFNEARLRFKDPGVGSHDFTPYLPANAGAASALAQRIAKGKEHIPVPYFVFTKFRVYDAPEHIISKDKKRELIKTYEKHAEGKARLEGEFYSNSMLVLSNLDRKIHLLPWSKEELFKRYPTGRIYRAIDPGLDHPTGAAWAVLLPINVWVFYRVFAEPGLTITQRAEKMIFLSNNHRIRYSWGPNKETDFYFKEVHPKPNSEVPVLTVCDWHTFRKDEVNGRQYSLNYILAGLQITESIHVGPEDRAVQLNDLLLPSQYTPHLLTKKPPGPKVYFLHKEPGIMEFFSLMEEFYWERKKSGDDKGAPKDKTPIHGDDVLDAVTYLTASPYRWTNFRPPVILVGDSEPEEDLIQASMTMRRLQPDPHDPSLQSLQKVSHAPVYFGSNPDESVEDEEAEEYD